MSSLMNKLNLIETIHDNPWGLVSVEIQQQLSVCFQTPIAEPRIPRPAWEVLPDLLKSVNGDTSPDTMMGRGFKVRLAYELLKIHLQKENEKVGQ